VPGRLFELKLKNETRSYPDDDSSDFAGAWSVYPYFKSGLLAVSSIEEGLFLVKRSESKSRRLRGARV